MMGLGYGELLLIFLIVFLIFGGRKIPEIARGLGRGIREFKKARDDLAADATVSAAPEMAETPAEKANVPAEKASPDEATGSSGNA